MRADRSCRGGSLECHRSGNAQFCNPLTFPKIRMPELSLSRFDRNGPNSRTRRFLKKTSNRLNIQRRAVRHQRLQSCLVRRWFRNSRRTKHQAMTTTIRRILRQIALMPTSQKWLSLGRTHQRYARGFQVFLHFHRSPLRLTRPQCVQDFAMLCVVLLDNLLFEGQMPHSRPFIQ